MKRLPGIMLWTCCAALGQDAAPHPDPKALKFGLPRPIQLPEVADFALPNGMRLLLVENRELPLVQGFALIHTGGLFDPPGRAGLAALTGMAMRSGGARGKSGEQLDQTLEDLAGTVESHIEDDYGQVSFSCPTESADAVLEIFRDVIAAPDFHRGRIDLEKHVFRRAIARRNGDLGEMASRELSSLVYGRQSPHGQRPDDESVNRIAREDLISFHERYYFPANTILAIAGDFRRDEMKDKIAKLFGAWSRPGEPAPPFPSVRQGPQPGIFLAAREDLSRTHFAIGHVGGFERDRDYAALELAAGILSGTGGARLSQRLRTEAGDSSAISVAWDAQRGYRGLFRISGVAPSSSTTRTVRAIREEVRRLLTSGVMAGELEAARQRALNSFIFHFDTPLNTLRWIALHEYHGYPRDFILRYQKAIAAVTRADILRVTKLHLRPDDLTIVIAGAPERFGEPLASLGLPVRPAGFFAMPEPEAVRAEQASPPPAGSVAASSTGTNARGTSPGLANLGAAGSRAARPGVGNLGATNSRAANSGLPNPGSTTPGMSGSAASNPGTENRGATNSRAANSGLSNPGSTTPGSSSSAASIPGTANPSTANSRLANPDVANPGATTPGSSSSAASIPGTANPSAASSSTASSVAANLGATNSAAANLRSPAPGTPTPATVNSTPAAQGVELLRRVQEAVGGAGRLAAVKDYFQTCEFKMSPVAGGMTAKQTNRWAGPSHYRQESELPMGKIAAYSDGTAGWLVTPQGKTGLPPALLKQIQTDLFRSFFQFLVSDRIPGRTVTALGGGVIEISDGKSISALLSIDEASGLPLKQTYTQMQPSGPPSTVEEVYSTWTIVSGIKVPSRITISQNGRKFAEVTVTEHRINTGLSPEELSKWP